MKHIITIAALLTTTAYGMLHREITDDAIAGHCFADACGIVHIPPRPISPIKRLMPRLSPPPMVDEMRPVSPAVLNHHGVTLQPRVPSVLASTIHPLARSPKLIVLTEEERVHQSALAGDAKAQYKYAHIMRSKGSKEHEVLAHNFMKQAADQGHRLACREYAAMLVSTDRALARIYYQRADQLDWEALASDE